LLRIVHHPHPALRYQSRPVVQIDDDLRKVVRKMFELMYAARGVGLAANQVALPFRFFVLNTTADPAKPEEEQVYINPEIVKRHASVEDEEGCLSLPGLYAKVRRARKIRVRAYDLAGKLIERDADELLSRVIQHETDHLDGKLFIDHVDPLELREHRDKIRGFEQEFRRRQYLGEILSDQVLKELLTTMSHPAEHLAATGIEGEPRDLSESTAEQPPISG